MREYKFPNIDPIIIQQTINLWNNDLTTEEIARIIGKSRATVCLYLKYAKVPIHQIVTGLGQSFPLGYLAIESWADLRSAGG